MIRDTAAMDRPVGKREAQKRRLPRFAIVGGAVLLLVAAGLTLGPSLSGWFAAERSYDREGVRFASVTRGDLTRDLTAEGRVVAAFSPTTSSPEQGIVQLRVQAGDVVEVGQVLAVVDSPELNSRLGQAQSTLQSLRSERDRQRIQAKQDALTAGQTVDLAALELEAAEREMERTERSRREGIVNDVDYVEAQDRLRRAEVSLRHARQDRDLHDERRSFELRSRDLEVERQQLVVDDLQRQVGALQVRSPVEGLVARLDVEDLDAVTRGQALVAVVDLSAFEVEIQIPESFADEVGPDTPIEITAENRTYGARLRTISPEVEGNRVAARIAFLESVPEGLRQNQRVSARLILDSRVDVLKVERGAFVEAGGGRRAYVMDGNLARLRKIELGALSVSAVEVLSGLEEGERIVVSDTARFRGAEAVYLRD